MTPVETVTQHARRLGFALVGIARPDEVQTFGQFEDWLAAGNAGTMAYLSWRREERRDARRVWPKTRSVVMLALPYRAAVSRPEPAPPNAGIVSSYAWGGDYHDWCRSRLDELLAALRGESDA